MRLPLRFTAGNLMAVVATLAVSWSVFFGIGDLFIYVHHAETERFFREGVVIWEEKGESAHAQESRRMAEYQNQMKRACLPRGATVPALFVSGLLMGGLGLTIRSRHGPWASYRPRWLNSLAAAFVSYAVIVAFGLVLGGAAYFTIRLIVLSGEI